MIGISSGNNAPLQQRGKVIAIEMDAAANADCLAKRRGPQRPALKQLQDALNDPRSAAFEFHTMLPPRHCQTRIRLRRRRIRPATKRRLPFLLPFRPRLLVVIEKKRLMRQPANQVVASAILYKPRLPHVEHSITRPITMSMLLCQQALTLTLPASGVGRKRADKGTVGRFGNDEAHSRKRFRNDRAYISIPDTRACA